MSNCSGASASKKRESHASRGGSPQKLVDRRADQLEKGSAGWSNNELSRGERPVQRDMQRSSVVLPRIFAVVRPLAALRHGGREDIDFEG